MRIQVNCLFTICLAVPGEKLIKKPAVKLIRIIIICSFTAFQLKYFAYVLIENITFIIRIVNDKFLFSTSITKLFPARAIQIIAPAFYFFKPLL